MEIKLDSEAMQNAVSAAVLSAITNEQRDILMKGALAYLMNKSNSNSYNSPTILQDAFNQAIRESARKLADELIAKDESVQERLKTLFAESMETVFVTKREDVVSKMADAFIKSMNADRY